MITNKPSHEIRDGGKTVVITLPDAASDLELIDAITNEMRAAIEASATWLIDLLDFLDGDPDLEPYLGFVHFGQLLDGEQDAGEQPEEDAGDQGEADTDVEDETRSWATQESLAERYSAGICVLDEYDFDAGKNVMADTEAVAEAVRAYRWGYSQPAFSGFRTQQERRAVASIASEARTMRRLHHSQ